MSSVSNDSLTSFSNLDSFYFFFFSDCCGSDFQNYRELCSLHCGVLNLREIQKRGGICICGADSFCSAEEANNGYPGGSVVENPPAMQEIQVQSLGWEDPLEKEMATHSSTLA